MEPKMYGIEHILYLIISTYFVSHGLIFVAIEFFRKRKTISKSQ